MVFVPCYGYSNYRRKNPVKKAELVCATCGEPFIVITKIQNGKGTYKNGKALDRKYCSDECKYQAMLARQRANAKLRTRIRQWEAELVENV